MEKIKKRGRNNGWLKIIGEKIGLITHISTSKQTVITIVALLLKRAIR
jgi:hypothetical protein